MVDRPPRDDSQQILATGFNLVIEILMVDRRAVRLQTIFILTFQSRNRDSYG